MNLTDTPQPLQAQALRSFLGRHERLFVLTGAGCSTASGIPDYRNAQGAWKRAQPVMFNAFMHDTPTRQRYWARSMIGWRRFRRARPNEAHRALAQLEREDRLELLVTQNVDRLHQAAGSIDVVDLHGRLDLVRCMGCGHRLPREALQEQLLWHNEGWDSLDATDAPDGDADLQGRDFSQFHVPACLHCAGILKPDVVFFGESVPPERVATAMRRLAHSDAVLVVGTSLMIYSGYRFVHAAAQMGKPIAGISLGRTRADGLMTLKLTQTCTSALAFLLPERPANAYTL